MGITALVGILTVVSAPKHPIFRFRVDGANTFNVNQYETANTRRGGEERKL
jgi:hypothetical protein